MASIVGENKRPRKGIIQPENGGGARVAPCKASLICKESLIFLHKFKGPSLFKRQKTVLRGYGKKGVYWHWWRRPALVAQCVKGLLPR
jgi:hypothetical protein